MKSAIITFSAEGHALGMKIAGLLPDASIERCKSGGLSAWTAAHFSDDALIFVGACGIAVRAIAPHAKSKAKDPAVVVIDELGRFAIPILSGHIGGANALALRLSRALGAVPVITTATDIHGLFAVDSWAAAQGLRIANPSMIKAVSARVLRGEAIRTSSDFPVDGQLPEGIELNDSEPHVVISVDANAPDDVLHIVPPIVTAGIGCRKGIAKDAIERAYAHALSAANCHPLAICRACSIDIKADEPGILAFCADHSLPYQTFPADALMAVPGSFTASAFVESTTGADNVCERSAVLGGGDGSRLILTKTAMDGVTMALSAAPISIKFDEVANQ